MKLPAELFCICPPARPLRPAASLFALAQSYPTRPVRIIVGFAPGGPADLIARLIGQSLSQRLGQQFIIETGRALGEIQVKCPRKTSRIGSRHRPSYYESHGF